MKTPLKIGNKKYKLKKDALNYYKDILNSYEFGELLSDEHYNDIIDLLNFDETYFDNHPEFIKTSEKTKNESYKIIGIRIGKVQYNTRCFELLYKNGETDFISYRYRINKRKRNSFNDFRVAARNVVQNDLNNVKQEYFKKHSKKGLVPCQETKLLSKWKELVVDHRQPNTFSIITDRFIELNNIELNKIEYKTDENNFFVFKDLELSKKFKNYHKEKATLRVVRKERNSSRAFQGCIKIQNKDLRIKTKQT